MRFSLLRIGAVVMTSALALAACGQSTSNAGGSKASTSANSTAFIGVEGTLSGALPVPAFPDGAVAYLKYANANHLVPGYTFKWKTADTANSGAQALTVSRQLIQADNAAAIISFGSVPIDALAKAHASLKVPIIASGDGDLFLKSDNMFTATPSYLALWHYALGLVPGHFHDSAASVVYQDDSFGQPGSTAATKYAKSEGVTVATQVPVPDTTTSDFTPFAARLKSAGAPVVIAVLAPELLAGVEAAANQLGYDPIWLTNWGAEESSVITAIGPAASRTYAVDFLSPISTTQSAAVTAYKSAMQQYYPSDVNNEFSEQGWNEAAVVVGAVKAVVAKHQSLNPANLQAAMEGVSGNVGMMTNFHYSSSQHYGITSAALLGYSGGAWHALTAFTTLPQP